MGIELCRVDDRLVHGQVATSWIRSNNINVVVIVDDEIANNKTQIQILKMSAPAGVKVYALSTEKFYTKYKENILNEYKVMLIFSNLTALYQLIKLGFRFPEINVAGLRYFEGKKQITKSVFLSKEDEEILKKISEFNIKLDYRQLMTDTKQNLLELL